MALASLGGLIAMTVTALVNWRCSRDFARDMAGSFQEQGSAPLGEVRMAEMLKEEPPIEAKKRKPAKAPGKKQRKRRRRG